MAGISFDDQQSDHGARIVVVGAGGGGGNAVNNMISGGLNGVTFIAANTDAQALEASRADHRIQLGTRLTSGLGAGADPERGREAAMENQSNLYEMLQGTDMVFVTAGMGGGTGTGAAPVIAKAAREAGALTVGVVTKPFRFEGKPRMRNAEKGIAELAKHVDSLIVIPNDRLLELSNEPMSLLDSFTLADDVLFNAVRAISDLIVVPGLVNVDFADAKRIMNSRGKAIMGMGEASGEGRAAEAAQRAMTSRLLEETTIEGATGILVNVAGGPDLKIQELNEAMTLIQDSADDTAEIIMGCVIDQSLTDRIRITIIATGFDSVHDYAKDLGLEAAEAMPADSADMRNGANQRRTGLLNNNSQVPPMPQRATLVSTPRDNASTMRPPARPMPPSPPVAPQRPTVKAYESTRNSEVEFDPSRPNDWF